MNCQNCGTIMGKMAISCPKCGTAAETMTINQVPTMLAQQSQATPGGFSASQRIDEQIKAINGDYLVIPFIGKIKSGFFSSENAETVSGQLQSLINWYSQQGWEFHSITKVGIEVSPGCLANLFGANTSYITFDQVVFRRAKP